MEDIQPSGQLDQAGGQSSTSSGEGESEVIRLRKHTQTLLSEKKKLQEQYDTKLQQIEDEKLQAEGKVKEYAENLKKQLDEQKTKNNQTHKLYSEKFLKQQFVQEATKLGCVNPDDAFKLANLTGVEVKDDFSLDSDGLSAALGDLQKSKPYLFAKDAKAPRDTTPKQPNGSSGAFDLKKATPAELAAILAAKQKQ